MSIFENRIKATSQILGVLLSQPILEEKVSEMEGLDDCPVFIDINDLNSFANSFDRSHDYYLYFAKDGLSLKPFDKSKHGNIKVDFLAGKNNHRRIYSTSYRSDIARAFAISSKNKPKILDCTAGFGSDAFSLASLGCEVKLIERNPLVYALLYDGIQRMKMATRSDKHFKKCIDISCEYNDSICYLNESSDNQNFFDAIYLDPMFPPKSKNAKAKKEMQAIQNIIVFEGDYDKLLSAALESKAKRVVVKRPVKGSFLSDISPSFSIKARTIRYDVFIKNS